MFAWHSRRLVSAYDKRRLCHDHTSICNAPVTNMYFTATGRVAPCWADIGTASDFWSRDRSIMDIWNGDHFTTRRQFLAARRFVDACATCLDQIHAGAEPLAAVYDRTEPEPEPGAPGLPTSFELELSNLCNFECQMCNGELSSKIRRNREHLPPIVSPYDERFVEEFVELLPSARDVRFSGGEPMMHPIVHQLAEAIADLRPDLAIGVSTNGSIRNERVERMLERSEVRMFLSFDSLRPDRYEAIRVGSDYDVLMSNIDSFRHHFSANPGVLVINTNPMRSNWDEMADFVRWCNERSLSLSFNTVVHPEHLALAGLPAGELQAVYDTLAAEQFEVRSGENASICRANERQFDQLVHQVDAWLATAYRRPRTTDAGTLVRLRS